MDTTPTFVHPTALVEAGAQLGANVRIGPFCHVASGAVIGDNGRLISHVVVNAGTEIGDGATIHPQAVIGDDPQNGAYRGEPTKLIIGRNATIREGVTMHRGTGNARGETRVGDHCMFLAYAHVAHDCVVGDHVTFANNVMLGGHVTVGDRVTIGGGAGVHQFCIIGRNAFVGGLAGVAHDVIPYGMVMGNRATLCGLNVVGMKRAGFSRADIASARAAYERLFGNNGSAVKDNAVAVRTEFADSAVALAMADFVLEGGRRQLTTPTNGAMARQSEQH